MSDPVELRLGHAKMFPVAIMGKPVIIVLDREKKRKRQKKRGKK